MNNETREVMYCIKTTSGVFMSGTFCYSEYGALYRWAKAMDLSERHADRIKDLLKEHGHALCRVDVVEQLQKELKE